MSKSSKTFITLILTYATKRIGTGLTNFEPLINFPGVLGYVVDISVWIALFYLIQWVLDKVIKTKEQQ